MTYFTFDTTPREVKKIKTKYREIKTMVPHPDTVALMEDLRRYEPRSMGGQPPIVWHKAQDFSVWDEFGNRWIDFSSGVLVANSGHLREEVKKELHEQIDQGMIHNYCFPNEPRAKLVKTLVSITSKGFDKCFLLTTGAEAVENALKLARTNGRTMGGDKKIGIISFRNAFHGRTWGAQMAGGIPSLKEWIVNLDKDFYQVPFPDGYLNEDTRFECFLSALDTQGIVPDNVAGVIMEPYQGVTGCFADAEYVRSLRKWCTKHAVLLIDDEIQAGFCRTGKMFAIEHYGVEPDMICCGKGISGGLPLSAVLGNSKFMDIYGPGEMTSTHSGNPLICRAAIKNIELLIAEDLAGKAESLGTLLHEQLNRIRVRFSSVIGKVSGRGLLAGILFRKRATKEPDGEIAFKVVEKCIQKGLMLYAPLGPGGATVKMNPPLIIPEETLMEGLSVFEESLAEVVGDG
jgi:4-aminobutyrate aminotransferase/(S)-3-amino-2-methylpropionate transaminase